MNKLGSVSQATQREQTANKKQSMQDFAMFGRSWKTLVPTLCLVLLAACTNAIPQDPPAPVLNVRVLKVFPHDSQAFSQGLAIEGDTLYESTGRYGTSTLRKVDLANGKVTQSMRLDPRYFGEGLTVIGDRIYQVTWKEFSCFVYDKKNLKYLGGFNYKGDGWGLADDEKQLFMSNGSNKIQVIDPETFKVTRRLTVKDGRRYIAQLNELEFFDDHIWANVWREDRIAKIDPQTGKVVAWLDCTGVYPAASRLDPEHVLNGIAYDESTGRIFLTGKNWPQLYEIEIVE